MRPNELYDALESNGKHNRYCGPAALAAITGLNTGEVTQMIREINSLRSVRGLANEHALATLSHAGVVVTEKLGLSRSVNSKINRLDEWLQGYYTGQLALVSAGHHYWAFGENKFVDSFTRIPTDLSEVHMPKAWVTDVWYLKRTKGA